MRSILPFSALAAAAFASRCLGGVAMVVTNYVTAVDVPVVTNLVTITHTNTLVRVVTNSVPSAEAAALERARVEEDERKRRIATKTFALKHASAAEVADKFNATWAGDFGSGYKIAKIAQAFPEANKVMVTAPGIVLDACEEVIGEVDVEPRQVYIEARFVELSNNASHKLGIDWSMLGGMKGSLSMNATFDRRRMKGVTSMKETGNTTETTYGTGGISDVNLSRVQGTIGMSDLYVVLRALESCEDARTFSNPKIIVASGRKATVDMTTKYPNVTIAVKKTINNNSTSVDLDMKMSAIPGEDKMMFAKEAFFSWGISLEVTPRVGEDGLIHVEIVPTVSTKTDEVTAGGGADANSSETYSARYPIIEMQRLLTEFNMSSGSTAVIGGLSRTEEMQVDNGIPWLRDWWWIGPRLFGSKVREKVQKEIIVFVTVGLVDPRAVSEDVGLPKNAVLGREYTSGLRKEPGDRRSGVAGVTSLDLRSLEVQASDPARTNREDEAKFRIPLPFTKRN